MDGASIPIAFSEGQDVIIVCNVSTSNLIVPTVMLSVKPDLRNVEFDEGTDTITIIGATAANQGIYTCTAADNVATPTTISFVLRMYLPATPTATTPTAAISTTDSVCECMSFLI